MHKEIIFATALCLLITSCSTTIKKNYCELSNEAIWVNNKSFYERIGATLYFDSTLVYRPIYKPHVPVEQIYDILEYPVTTKSCKLIIPDSLRPYCEYYTASRNPLTDSVKVQLYSPLLPTKQKGVYSIQHYSIANGLYPRTKIMAVNMYLVKRKNRKFQNLPPLDLGGRMSIWRTDR